MHSPSQNSPGTAATGGLKRGLSMRHIRFIALGSAIGTGLFLGSAETIKAAGPAVLVSYIVAGACVFLVMRALGEMAVRHPVAGSFANYAHHYLGPYFGFLAGWTFVFEMLLVAIADMTAVTKYMALWFPGTPGWVWMLAAIALIIGLNLMRVRVFGEVEFWFSLIKVVTIVALIAGGLALLVFGVSVGGHTPSVGNLWEGAGGFAPLGVWGIVMSLGVVAFSFGGIETLGSTAGEADRPERSIPKAINSVPVRILLFYVLSLAVILCLVPWQQLDPSSSPFVTVFSALGLPAAQHLVNFVVLTAALSAMNSITYASARLMYGLAQQGQAPRAFGAVRGGSGVPLVPVLVVLGALLVGLGAYLLIPDTLFLMVASIASFATVSTWVFILCSHLAMRRRLRAAGERTVYRMPGSPVTSAVALAFCAFVLVAQAFSPSTVWALVIGVAWVVLASLGFLLLRGRGREPLELAVNPAAMAAAGA
ncbi:MAG: amino acid permease [Arthrobacter sp.]|nr:amino acid permease [Arthrobacter sp.]